MFGARATAFIFEMLLRLVFNLVIHVVHQTWISHELPCALKWPGCKVWNDTEVDQFVHHFTHYHHLFRTIKAGAYKADIFRYMVLYVRGGWYADMDNKPVNFPVIIPKARVVLVRYNDPFDWMIKINFMGAKRGHPVFLDAIRMAMANIAAGGPSVGAHRYFGVTGPEVFGNAVNRYIGNPAKIKIHHNSRIRDIYVMAGN